MFRFPVKRSNEKENDDEEGLKKLYNQILSYCRQHLLDDTAAEECTQEVFALYFQKTSQTEIHNPRAWLYRTADNYLHRYNRNFQHEKQMTLPLPNSEDGADSVEDKRFRYDPDFDRLLEENIDIDKDVKKVLSGLNNDELKLYDLHYRRHLPLKELAIAYNLTVAAVKNKIYRLKLHIVKLVQKAIEDERKG